MILILLLSILSVSLAVDTALVSVYPFYDLIKEIGKGRFKTEVLIPPRADYHHYELTPGDILKVSKAKVVFVSGVPLGGWERKLGSLTKGKVVKLSRNIELIKFGRIGADPHLWLSPKRMKLVARNSYMGFVEVDPKGKRVFEDNLERVLKKLDKLDRLYSETLSKCRIRTLPVIHPSLGYLARDYRLKQIYLSGGHVHGGLMPKGLLSFVKELRSRGIDFILTVKGSPSKEVEVLKNEYNLKVYEINVKILPTKDTPDYFSVMEFNLSVLRKALRCM